MFSWPQSEKDWSRYRLKDEQVIFFNRNGYHVEMERGYASFHHPLLIHGSFENLSDRPRRACVLNVFADGTLSDSYEEILVGVPKIVKGKKIEGQFFPLLYPVD